MRESAVKRIANGKTSSGEKRNPRKKVRIVRVTIDCAVGKKLELIMRRIDFCKRWPDIKKKRYAIQEMLSAALVGALKPIVVKKVDNL